MASQGKQPEIIDLTEPDVIELDSEGEIVDETPEAPRRNGTAQTGQAKKKRKKRKKKPSGANGSAEDVGSTSADASRAQSPTLHVEGSANGAGSGLGGAGRKRSLADRLEDAPREDRPTGRGEQGGERRRDKERAERREREYGRESDRDRDRDRDGERGGERRKERERRRSRSPRRDREQERDRDGDRPRRRSRSRERERERRNKKREKGKAPESDAQLFFEDVTPAEVPGLAKPPSQSVAGPSNPVAQMGAEVVSGPQASDGLLLPAHVSVTEDVADADASPLKVPTPEGSDDDEDYIDYLDYDDDRKAPGMVRYWELEKLAAEEAKTSKPTRFVCKKCGAEGEHKTYECPVLICLTCGARDEHSTRSCPISKVCFTCGMKGHINKTCPNRGKSGAYYSSHDCDRCGARTHQTNECPTLWRMYRYVEDDVRLETLRVREEKRVLALGEGGEGYIASDEWCYNCGGSGHLGDDCDALPHQADLPNEPSAFSLYNILSGPFSSEATASAARSAKRAPRDWEAASAFADGFGFTAPMEVGKQGKRKQRDRLERRQRELEDAEDDQDDWFGGARSRARSGPQDRDRDKRGPSRSGGGGAKANGSGKIQFNFSGSGSGPSQGGGRDAKRQRTSYDDLPGPSRETDSIQIRGAARKPSYSSAPPRNRGHNRYEYDRDRDRDSQRRPRYRGGYSR